MTSMPRRVLVAYATRHGSTHRIATTVCGILRDAGVDADCRSVGEVDSIAPYGAVILGSAMYMDTWQVDAVRLLRRHLDVLAERPLWLFSGGPLTDPPAVEAPLPSRPEDLEDLAVAAGARGHVVFGGRPATQAAGTEQAGAETAAEGAGPAGDFRDWDVITEWAQSMVPKLLAALPAAGADTPGGAPKGGASST